MMDYCFLKRADEAEPITVLVLKERQSRAIQSRVVSSKSTVVEQGVAAERAADGILRFGHRNKVIMKPTMSSRSSRQRGFSQA